MSESAKRLLIRAFLSGFNAAKGRVVLPRGLAREVCEWWKKEYPHDSLDEDWVVSLIEEWTHGV